jgi:hypothetical protein
MGRESLANRLAVKRKAGFLRTFNKRIETLKHEKERLEKTVENPDSLADQPWTERVERTVQGFIGAGPVYGITAVSDWAQRTLDHIKHIKQNDHPLTDEDIHWITSITQELVLLHSEALAEIQDDLTQDELADPPSRISRLPLGAFPSARKSNLNALKPDTEASAEESGREAAEEIGEPSDTGTLPPEPVTPAPVATEDTAQEIRSQSAAPIPDEETALGEASIPPPTASIGVYAPPWEPPPSTSEAPESGASQPVDIETSHGRNVENTIPLTIEDLTAVVDDRSRNKPPPPLGLGVGPVGKVPFGWKLLTGGLVVALLISLYFNWRGYTSATDQPISGDETALDTEQTGAAPVEPTPAADGDNATSAGANDPSRVGAQATSDKDVPSASKEAPKKKKRRSSRSRSKSRTKKTRAATSEQQGATKTAEPRPSRTTGVLSILVPANARGPVAITVDKRPKGNAPLKLSLTPGLHEVVQKYKRTRTMRIVLIQQGKTKVITAKVPK